MKTREIYLKSRPVGMPTEANFELVQRTLPEPAEGEILVRNQWISVDPYMRGRMREGDSYVEPFALGKPMEGGCVGKVIQSNRHDLAEGDYVLGDKGWRDCWVSDGQRVVKVNPDAAPVQRSVLMSRAHSLGGSVMGTWSPDFPLGVYGHRAAFRGRVRPRKGTLTTHPAETPELVEAG